MSNGKFVTSLCSGYILDTLELVEIALQKEVTNKVGEVASVNRSEHKGRKVEKKSSGAPSGSGQQHPKCGKGFHNFASI